VWDRQAATDCGGWRDGHNGRRGTSTEASVHVLACAIHLAELSRQADAASERALKPALSVAKPDTR
jgi:hypothetical protein